MKKTVILVSFIGLTISLFAMSHKEKADTTTQPRWHDIKHKGDVKFYFEGEEIGQDLFEYFKANNMIFCDKTGKLVILDTLATQKLFNTVLMHTANKNADDALTIEEGILGIYWNLNSTFGHQATIKYKNGFEKKDFLEDTLRTFRIENPDKKVDPKAIHMLKAFVADTLKERRFDESIGLGEACKILKEAIKN